MTGISPAEPALITTTDSFHPRHFEASRRRSNAGRPDETWHTILRDGRPRHGP